MVGISLSYAGEITAQMQAQPSLPSYCKLLGSVQSNFDNVLLTDNDCKVLLSTI